MHAVGLRDRVEHVWRTGKEAAAPPGLLREKHVFGCDCDRPACDPRMVVGSREQHNSGGIFVFVVRVIFCTPTRPLAADWPSLVLYLRWRCLLVWC